ncbi:PH domain-containing protein [Bacillus piscicola]|uniref:PH domain-containing protein n=1 Tax=Bacillus piscicola TaxID=1632684 RepID=UPI001F09D48A|nr:PH domain-containing protein [Bacillus piscicola]
MRHQPAHRISQKALSVWRIKGVIETFFLLVIPAGLFFAASRFDLPLWYFWSVLIVVLLYGVWKTVFLPKIRWRIWRYEVSSEEVELLRGIFIRKHTMIPMSRVQHVDTAQGPLYKKFNLTAVTISTAAGTHEIPALTENDGMELRAQIAELAGMDENHA